MTGPRAHFFTATTLDGFLADDRDSLDWLFEQHIDEDGPGSYQRFIPGIGSMAMGATTYLWLRDHLAATGEPWSYDIPCWVFTHRELEPLGGDIRMVSGPVGEHWPQIAAAAGERDVWVVGGGDLAGQFADAGHLHRLVVAFAPVTLGSGRPLFPRRHDFALVEQGRNGDFLVATYDVSGPRTRPSARTPRGRRG